MWEFASFFLFYIHFKLNIFGLWTVCLQFDNITLGLEIYDGRHVSIPASLCNTDTVGVLHLLQSTRHLIPCCGHWWTHEYMLIFHCKQLLLPSTPPSE